MEQQKNYHKARVWSLAFVGVLVLIIGGMLVSIITNPYDSGVLMGASLSGNNQYGGKVAATKDYVFMARPEGVVQYNQAEATSKVVYEGQVSHLNPYDGWVYFVEDGGIYRIAYYGGEKQPLGNAKNVTYMSVNGLWIYYLQQDGNIGKLRTDGKQQRLITDGKVKFTAFESDNRIIVATDGTTIYRMKTDGTDCLELATGKNITRMLYTLDRLFYCDDGQVKQIKSVEAGRDDGTTYGELAATVFTYDVNQENRGQIFYLKDGQLWVRLLASPQKGHEQEEDFYLAHVADAVDLYSVDADVYYHDTAGGLHRVYIGRTNDQYQTQVEVVE